MCIYENKINDNGNSSSDYKDNNIYGNVYTPPLKPFPCWDDCIGAPDCIGRSDCTGGLPLPPLPE